jgi:hypothetical protein
MRNHYVDISYYNVALSQAIQSLQDALAMSQVRRMILPLYKPSRACANAS